MLQQEIMNILKQTEKSKKENTRKQIEILEVKTLYIMV